MTTRFPESVATNNEQPSELDDTKCLDECLAEPAGVRLREAGTPIPHYSTFRTLTATGKKGFHPGEFRWAMGVSIQEETGNIYVADMDNHRIQIFSKTGLLLDTFVPRTVIYPWGVLVHQNCVYVTDTLSQSIIKFSLPRFKKVKQVGKSGSGREEFDHPRQLAISPDQLLYVPDEFNDRIQILNCQLKFKDTFNHPSLFRPVDVKFTTNLMLVMSSLGNYFIKIFSLSGENIRTIIPRYNGLRERKAYFFCLDSRNNIIISDHSAHDISVFSPDGDLMQTIGTEGHQAGMFYKPCGVAILENSSLVCVSQNSDSIIQIFF